MERERVVRVRTRAMGGGLAFRHGSGYVIAPGCVLTVAHVLLPPDARHGYRNAVVEDLADTCEVSQWREGTGIEWRRGRRVAVDLERDVAVVTAPGLGEGLDPVRWGRVERDDDVSWTAIGFPSATLEDHDGSLAATDRATAAPTRSRKRQPEQLSGVMSPTSFAADGLFRLRITSGDVVFDGDRSSGWGGASGAAVFSDGCLLGLVTDHLKTFERSLVAVRAVSLVRRPELWEALGRPSFELVTADGAVEHKWALRVEALVGKLVEEARHLPYARILTAAVEHGQAPPPELTEVYIEQQQVRVGRREADATADAGHQTRRRGRAADDGSEQALRVNAEVTVQKALGQWRNLVIEGDPGTGKSTLLHNLVLTLADNRTGSRDDEPGRLVPIYVAARRLAGIEGALPDRLVRALDEGDTAGVEGLSTELFTDPREHVSWLVLVDALDEVIDPVARAKLVALLRETTKRQPGRFRFVVTSRPLPDLGAFESAAGDAELFARFRLRPFGPGQRRQFAAAWFRSRMGDPTAAVDAFIEAVERTALADLTGSPLLLTMAAVLFERHDGGALPTNRAGIYREFVRLLLWDDERLRRTREGLERHWRDFLGDSGELVASELFSRRQRLLEDIAGRYEGGAGELGLARLAAGSPVVTDVVPQATALPAGWLQEQVELLLRRSGLITSHGGELMFAHDTVREYLAACDVTRSVEFHSEAARRFIDGWSGSQRDVVLFAFGIWADKAPGEDLTDLLRFIWRPGMSAGRWTRGELLHRQRQLFVGTAVAEGLTLEPAYEKAIVAALVNLTSAYGPYAQDEPRTVAEEAVRVLGRLRRVDELHAIASDTRPTWEGSRIEARVEAASVLAPLGWHTVSVNLLRHLARRHNARAVQALADLDETEQALRLARDRLRSGWSYLDADEPADYLALLGRLGYPAEAVAAAHELLEERLRRVPPATEYRNARTRVRINIAAVLSGLGERDAAAKLLVEIARDRRNIGVHRTQAVAHLTAMHRPRDLATVVHQARAPAPIGDAVQAAAHRALSELAEAAFVPEATRREAKTTLDVLPPRQMSARSLRTRLYDVARWGFLVMLSFGTANAVADLTAWTADRYGMFNPGAPGWVVALYGFAWFVAQLGAAYSADMVASTKVAMLRLPVRGPFLPWSRLSDWYKRLAVWPIGPVVPWLAAQAVATVAGGPGPAATALFYLGLSIASGALLFQVFMLTVDVEDPVRLYLHSLHIQDQPSHDVQDSGTSGLSQ